jgi:uncharacterized membrane protein
MNQLDLLFVAQLSPSFPLILSSINSIFKDGIIMSDLTTQTLPAVPHVVFGIFNLAIPNIIFWVIVIVVLFLGSWARLPKFIEHSNKPDAEEGKK